MNTSDRIDGMSWVKSSHSAENGTCVEMAFLDDEVAVRDSKNPAGDPLRFGSGTFATFVDTVKTGGLDVR